MVDEGGPSLRSTGGASASHRAIAKSASSFRFSATMTAAMSAATIVSQRGATNAPSLRRSAVNMTSGTTAKESCRLSTTWLKIKSFAAPSSP